MKSNQIRRSYFFNKMYFKNTTKLYNFLKYKKKKKKAVVARTVVNSLYILMRPNNTFVTYVGEIKKSNKYTKTITAGTSGFKGPKRSSPYSRHVVARNMSYYIFINKVKTAIDLYLNSLITRKFFFFFKGLIVKPMNVRFIIKNKMRAHGFLRPQKKRRK